MMDIGVIQGYSNGSFDPNRSMTRVEMAVTIYRVIQYANTTWSKEGLSPLNKFTDSDSVPIWGIEAFDALLMEKIIEGDTQNNLRPMEQLSRAEAVTILIRILAIIQV